MRTSETATMRLLPGPQACLPWLARGVGPKTANCHTSRPEDPRKMPGTLCNLWGLLPTKLADCRRGSSLREVLGCRLPGIAALRPPCQYASKMSMPRNRSLLLQNRKTGPHQPTRSTTPSREKVTFIEVQEAERRVNVGESGSCLSGASRQVAGRRMLLDDRPAGATLAKGRF